MHVAPDRVPHTLPTAQSATFGLVDDQEIADFASYCRRGPRFAISFSREKGHAGTGTQSNEPLACKTQFQTILVFKAALILLQSVPKEVCIRNLKNRLEKVFNSICLCAFSL